MTPHNDDFREETPEEERRAHEKMRRDILGEEGAADMAELEQEDIAARFAHIEKDGAGPTHLELPPVPDVTFERPLLPGQKPPATGGTGASATTGDDRPAFFKTAAGGTLGGGEGLRGAGMGYTVGTTLVVSIVFGVGLGWLIDRFVLRGGANATPWGLIAGFLFGVGYGFYNLIKVSNRINAEDGSGK